MWRSLAAIRGTPLIDEVATNHHVLVDDPILILRSPAIGFIIDDPVVEDLDAKVVLPIINLSVDCHALATTIHAVNLEGVKSDIVAIEQFNHFIRSLIRRRAAI